MAREIIRRTLPKKTPTGMEELYSTPRKKEADTVKKILKEHSIKYRSREEFRNSGWRYVIYAPKLSKGIIQMLDELLMEAGY